ncbi:MAG: peptidylprolyl isomerase [Pyrinomonadaceae bacterium]
MKIITLLILILSITLAIPAQRLASPKIGTSTVPDATLIAIVKAEDARNVTPLVPMLADKNAAVRYRAALAAGRIGDDKAVDGLISLLTDESVEVRAMAAFAIGEVESAKGSDAIVKLMDDVKTPNTVMARAVEAAGKIAAANPRDPKSKDLGDAILDVLDFEIEKGDRQNLETIRLGITGILRARPNEGDLVVAKFLTHKDARIRADAANTLTRLRSKRANPALREIAAKDTDPIARANAARALGAAEDKESLNLLLNAATKDVDSRVRVSAIRSFALLNEKSAIDPLLEHGNHLLEAFQKRAKPAYIPAEKSELLEIATALRTLAANTANEKIVGFLQNVRKADRFSSSETEIALATVAPALYAAEFNAQNDGYSDWHVASAYAQGLGVLTASTDQQIKSRAIAGLMGFITGMGKGVKPRYQSEMLKAIPAIQRTNAAFKPDNLNDILQGMLANSDVNVRGTAADLMANQPPTPANVEAIKKAFSRSLIVDKMSDDATLAIMAALFRLDKKGAVGVLLTALDAPNYLVRRRAFQMLADPELQKASPGIAASLEKAKADGKDKVLPYKSFYGTRLGQMVNTEAYYRRALARKNGSVKAAFRTTKGSFTIDFMPEDAPLTVDNFIKLARVGYFNGAEVHRVVANFVMQDGDPTGTGNGGPGTTIRCEINMLEFERGSVGMALSGKDTGGSQWFVDHAPQPHLDGGYTVFGQVNETGMKVVDNIVRGDKIISVRIIGR